MESSHKRSARKRRSAPISIVGAQLPSPDALLIGHEAQNEKRFSSSFVGYGCSV
jgi:hypothetical protein